MRIGVPSSSSHLLKHVPDAVRQSWYDTPYEPRLLRWNCGGNTYFALRPKVIPGLVAHGILDEGICGSDSLDEFFDRDLLVTTTLASQRGVRMVVASHDPRVLEDPLDRPLIVGTTYPATASAVFDLLAKAYILVEQPGCVEGFCPDLVDVIVDIVETGATLRENSLTVVHELGELSVVRVRRR